MATETSTRDHTHASTSVPDYVVASKIPLRAFSKNDHSQPGSDKERS